MEEDGGKYKENEIQLKRIKSRELRGGVMYYSCHCIKRNGLQHDCRRTGCGGEPTCLVLPDPLCAPSQLARARGLADPTPLAAHYGSQSGGAASGIADSGYGGGKRFIVCELKGIIPDTHMDQGGSTKCCKCLGKYSVPLSTPVSHIPGIGHQTCVCSTIASQNPKLNIVSPSKCPCTCSLGLLKKSSIFDETVEKNMKRFESIKMAFGTENARGAKMNTKEEPCNRPDCIHWQPPSPCLWDAPCKADCFETPVGIQSIRNPLSGGGGAFISSGRTSGSSTSQHPQQRIKLLMPECCTGCSAGTK